MAKSPSGKSQGPSGGQRQLRVRVKTARKRTASSQRWLDRQLNDPYVAAAKREGWRSRAAFKLIEIDNKAKFLKPGQTVVDLGAAPGGWSQVAVDRVKALDDRGTVIAIDYLAMEPVAGADILLMDFMDDAAPDELIRRMANGRADVVLSDMAAPTTGHTGTDHLRIMGLAEAAADFAVGVLKPGGTFLAKVFQGGAEKQLLDVLKQNFAVVRHVKPPSSRSESAELYVLATGFRGRTD